MDYFRKRFEKKNILHANRGKVHIFKPNKHQKTGMCNDLEAEIIKKDN